MEDIEKEIIVIGNGTSVLNYQMGELIDSFREVVRFNDYQTKGYESFIGSKTTIWARSNSKRTREREWLSYKNVIIASPEWNFGNIKNIIKDKSNAIVIPKEQSLDLQNELELPGRVVKRGEMSKRGWPSTGLLILNYLLKYNKFVYIYGFDCFKKEGGDPRHYYNNKEKMITTYVHSEDKEKEWINKKILEGKIKEIHRYV
jgi:hypothetical protein